MANFFGKARISNNDSPSKDMNTSAGPSCIESDFQKTFKPFVLKKDAELASLNYFANTRRSNARKLHISRGNIIVIDDNEDEDESNVNNFSLESNERDTTVDISELSPQRTYIMFRS